MDYLHPRKHTSVFSLSFYLVVCTTFVGLFISDMHVNIALHCTAAGPIVNKMLLLTTGLTAIGLAYLIVFDQGLTLTVKQLMHA